MKNKLKYLYVVVGFLFLVSFGMIGSYFGNRERSSPMITEVATKTEEVVENGENNGIDILDCGFSKAVESNPFRFIASTLFDISYGICVVSACHQIEEQKNERN